MSDMGSAGIALRIGSVRLGLVLGQCKLVQVGTRQMISIQVEVMVNVAITVRFSCMAMGCFKVNVAITVRFSCMAMGCFKISVHE